MWSVDLYLTGKNNENQLFQVHSITEYEKHECVAKDKRSHAVFISYSFFLQEDKSQILLLEQLTTII